MGIGKAGSILAPALYVLNLPVALARAPGKIAFGSGGRVEDFACVDIIRNSTMSLITLVICFFYLSNMLLGS
jgi:hypothetical protein